jgi:hypothetical protein
MNAEARLAALAAAFDPNGEDAPLTIEDIKAFLGIAAEHHMMPALNSDDYAKAIVDQGFTTKHSVAEITKEDLRDMGFLPAHARTVARYGTWLSGRCRRRARASRGAM